MNPPRTLLTVPLRGGIVHLPFSMAELLAAREGRSDDPKVQRHLYVNFMQSVWRDWRHTLLTISPRGSIGDPPTDVPYIAVKAPLAISLPLQGEGRLTAGDEARTRDPYLGKVPFQFCIREGSKPASKRLLTANFYGDPR